MALLTRSAVADFLNIGTKANKVWALCGTGFNSLDESPNAQVESKVYIHEDEASPSITRYEEYLRTDFKVEEDGTPITTIVPARLFTCAVEVSDIQGGGGETLTMSGNLNVVGKFLDGTFNLETLQFTEGGEMPEKEVKALTVTVRAGQTSGKVKMDVTPDVSQNNKYLVKVVTGTAPDAPEYNDYISEGWTFWDGYDEITAASGSIICVAEVSNANRVKGYGTVTNSTGG